MKSMTGFGLGTAETQSALIEVSIRAVNGRFLETRFHVPRELLAVEPELKQILSQHFQRGTLDIFLSKKPKGGGSALEVGLNLDLAKQYLKAHKDLSKKLKLKSTLTADSLARMPEVLKLSETSSIQTIDAEAAKKAMSLACKAALSEREREGKSLVHEMAGLLKTLEQQVAQIESLRGDANQQLEQKLEQRIAQRLSKSATSHQGAGGVESGRLGLELSFLLERADINEEIMRLQEHLQNYKALLSQKDPVGKKLDFYTQELLREVNTIGSKSNLSKLTQYVVEAKTTIERLREQVQNIE
jgi:uncharacterized protein (TIGR00255 family)